MFLTIVIHIVVMFVALNGLIYQPKKDVNKPVSWKNMNVTGKILFGLIILLTILNVAKSIHEVKARESKINELINSQKELKEINSHLIKVMSVVDGYNALIRGVVSFRTNVNEAQIRNALRNLFLKYVEIDLTAENKLGKYNGRIDYATHPEVRKFLRLSSEMEPGYFSRYGRHLLGNSYFFEIRCSGIKILNESKIQYAPFSPEEHLNVQVNTFEWSRDFGRLYHIEMVMIDEVEIEELGKVRLEKVLTF